MSISLSPNDSVLKAQLDKHVPTQWIVAAQTSQPLYNSESAAAQYLALSFSPFNLCSLLHCSLTVDWVYYLTTLSFWFLLIISLLLLLLNYCASCFGDIQVWFFKNLIFEILQHWIHSSGFKSAAAQVQLTSIHSTGKTVICTES